MNREEFLNNLQFIVIEDEYGNRTRLIQIYSMAFKLEMHKDGVLLDEGGPQGGRACEVFIGQDGYMRWKNKEGNIENCGKIIIDKTLKHFEPKNKGIFLSMEKPQ